jgi:hypothetical protein
MNFIQNRLPVLEPSGPSEEWELWGNVFSILLVGSFQQSRNSVRWKKPRDENVLGSLPEQSSAHESRGDFIFPEREAPALKRGFNDYNKKATWS